MKNFANLKSFENDPSKWKEWRRHSLNAVKESSDSFATLIESFEKRDAEIDEFAYDPTQSQQSVNLHVRLSNCTTGFAHNIVEGVSHNNGGEAWRLLNQQFDPKTDTRMMTLVLEIIECKIKGKDVLAGLVKWKTRLPNWKGTTRKSWAKTSSEPCS